MIYEQMHMAWRGVIWEVLCGFMVEDLGVPSGRSHWELSMFIITLILGTAIDHLQISSILDASYVQKPMNGPFLTLF